MEQTGDGSEEADEDVDAQVGHVRS